MPTPGHMLKIMVHIIMLLIIYQCVGKCDIWYVENYCYNYYEISKWITVYTE